MTLRTSPFAFEMASKSKKTTTRRRYSAEDVIASLMDDSDSEIDCDTDDDDDEEYSPNVIKTSSPKTNENNDDDPLDINLSPICDETISKNETDKGKTYTELKTFTCDQTIRSSPDTVHLESSGDAASTPSSGQITSSSEQSSLTTFRTDRSTSSSPNPIFPEDKTPLPSTDPSSYSTYSSTSSKQPPKKVGINRSTSSTSSDPSDVFPEDNDPVSDNESEPDSLDDFHTDAKSETVNKKRALFHVAEVPFNSLCQMIRSYLESIEKDPLKPVWPVPDMDRNQKRNFRKKTENFKLINGSLRHHHVYVDQKNQVKRGKF